MGSHVNATLRARFRALRRAKRIVRRMQVECEPAGGFSLSELCEMAADVPAVRGPSAREPAREGHNGGQDDDTGTGGVRRHAANAIRLG